MQSTITTGANSFVQHAAIAALEGPRDAVDHMRERYRARRDMVQASLAAIPDVKLAPIASTFYAFPDVSAYLGRRAGNHVMDSVEVLCDWLLEHHGVATVPGSAFGDNQCIRLSFAASEVNLEKALARIAKAFASLA
jgi:aspartate aminotransferase